MSINRALVVRQHSENNGAIQQHNFKQNFSAPDELKKPSTQVAQSIANHTKEKLSTILWEKASTIQGTAQSIHHSNSTMIKYTPSSQGLHNSGANARMIKMQTIQSDPIMPKGHKHKKIPRGPGSPPATVLHSPPRKLTAKDMEDWKIPPCISNWKNAKGYTLPLEYRIAADGRALQSQTINDKFGQMADAYYLAEKQARTEIEERNKISKNQAYKDYLKKEDIMRQAAANAREEKNRIFEEVPVKKDSEDIEGFEQRQELLYMRKRELEHEQRLEYAGKNKAKAVRDRERDISEKIAINQAQPTKPNSESLFDQRLFNQTAGMNSGFGDDDDYNIYTKPLYQDRTAANIYNNIKNVPDEEEDLNQQVDKINKTKTFEGALQTKTGRNKPVEFEKKVKFQFKDDDIFGMDQFVDKKKVKQ